MNSPVNSEDKSRIPGGIHFLVRIQYQQHASWQGTIQWLDNRKTLPFRSALELLLLMEEALACYDSEQQPFRHWNREKGTG